MRETRSKNTFSVLLLFEPALPLDIEHSLGQPRTSLFYRTLDTSTVRQLEHLSAKASKGVSSWLNTLPLNEHGFSLSRCDFRDCIEVWMASEKCTINVCLGQGFHSSTCHVLSDGGGGGLPHRQAQ